MEKDREKEKLYFLTGPTACGKTTLSIALAQSMNAEIISADSIQIYRGMDIGSAKPSEAERQGVAHHMLDIVPPDEKDYSVARYRQDALSCARDIAARGKKPLVVGGTGLYVNSLIYPLDFPSAPPDGALRAYWNEREAGEKGSAHKRLKEIDPQTAKRLYPNDVKRVIRAIEVIEGTGETLSSRGADFTKRDDENLPFRPVLAGLTLPRETLYGRIEARVDAMMRAGLENEVRALLKTGVEPALPAMQGLGYKQMAAYLRGECTRDEAIETIKRETRRYAKRQLTWFRREERLRWFDATEHPNENALCGAVYAYFTEA